MILSKAFICYTLFDNVPEEILLQGFLLYLSKDEADLLKQSISDFDDTDTDELYDVLERFNCRKRVNSSDIRDVVIELARQELIQKPHIMASVMAPVLRKLLEFSCFTSPEKPTPRKIIKILVSNPVTESERECLKFFERFIRGLESKQIGILMRFITCSEVIAVENIEVTFTQMEGTLRRPISHTCGPVLELPSTYSNFCELREEFQNIVNGNDWEMDIV